MKRVAPSLSTLNYPRIPLKRKCAEPGTPCIPLYASYSDAASPAESKAALSRRGGGEEDHGWPTSSFSPSRVRHASPPTRRRFGFLGHGCTRGRPSVPILSPRGSYGEARASSESRSAAGGFDERTLPLRSPVRTEVLRVSACLLAFLSVFEDLLAIVVLWLSRIVNVLRRFSIVSDDIVS